MAFAQLAEEYLRAERYEEAVQVTEAGLQRHPGYLSARVVLGRALIGLARYNDARTHLEQVVKAAPENLAAIRGLAALHQRQGEPDPSTSTQDRPASREQDVSIDLPAESAPDAPEMADLDLSLRTAASTQAELDSATSEFARALEALDGVSFDLPTYDLPLNELPADTSPKLEAPPVADLVDIPDVPVMPDVSDVPGEWDLPELVRETAAAKESEKDAGVLAELEDWLTAVVGDRRTRTGDPR